MSGRSCLGTGDVEIFLVFTDNLYLRSNPLIYKSRADYQKKKKSFPPLFQ